MPDQPAPRPASTQQSAPKKELRPIPPMPSYKEQRNELARRSFVRRRGSR